MGENLQNNFNDINQTRITRNEGFQNQTEADTYSADSYENPSNYNERQNSNNRLWSDFEKIRLVLIDMEEREKGYRFMERIKKRWDREFPNKNHSLKNLRNSAVRFKKDKDIAVWLRNIRSSHSDQIQLESFETVQESKKVKWTNEMKVKLLQIETEVRKKGRGYMQRLKIEWDMQYPEFNEMKAQCLRDNAAKFKKNKTIMNLVLIRNREHFQNEDVDQSTDGDVDIDDMNTNFQHGSTAGEREQIIKEEDKELELAFLSQLEKLKKTTKYDIEERARTLKVQVENDLILSANRILKFHIKDDATLSDITDKVYAMATTIEIRAGVKRSNTQRKSRKRENRRTKKMTRQIKELRQLVAQTANEIYRKKTTEKQLTKKRRYWER